MIDSDPAGLAAWLAKRLNDYPLAYLHLMRAPVPEIDAFALGYAHFGERLILNDGIGPDNAEATLQAYPGAALSFARHFIGNPDLVRRLRESHPLARFDRKTLYTPGAAGYTNYPSADR